MKLLSRALLVMTLALGICLGTGQLASAQIEDNISVYSEENAKGYMAPLNSALGAGFSNGLYYSAYIPSSFFIRIEVQASAVQFGDEDKTFQASTEPYYPNPTQVNAPTVVGSESGVTISDNGPGGSGATFTFPGGLDLDALGLAVPQLRIGGLKGTEAIIRWVAFDTNDKDLGKISLFGLGGRHSISQWMNDPIIELAVMVNYMKFDLSTDLIDQEMWNVGAQVSKRFGVIEPYGGIAIDRWSMDLKYDYVEPGGQETQYTISYEAENKFHATLGVALHASVVHLNAEVNFQELMSFTVGLSIGN